MKYEKHPQGSDYDLVNLYGMVSSVPERTFILFRFWENWVVVGVQF